VRLITASPTAPNTTTSNGVVEHECGLAIFAILLVRPV
jgi:hypothetical protein